MPLWTDYGAGWVKARLARGDHAFPAFLCCPGPSLALVDREIRGPGRMVYAMNTAYPRIKPDAWIGLDRMACFDSRLWHEPFPKITRHFADDNGRMRHHPNVFYADLEEADPAEIFIRRDHGSKFIWQKNTLIFAVHYLVWAGHKRIYFTGCDMGGSKDYHDDRELTTEQHENNRRLYAAQTRTLQRLAPLAARNGIEFVSCTPRSPLNAFMPCLELSAALRQCESLLPPVRPVLHVFEADARAGVLSGPEAGGARPAPAPPVAREVVLVLRSGGDFRPEHVGRLVRQLPPCEVTLLTDLTGASFPPGVHVVPLKYGWPGWWAKMELFSPELPGFREKPFLYLDLDTTVRALPDDFFAPRLPGPGARSVVMAPYTAEEEETVGGIQSNVMLLHPREREIVWERWRQDARRFMRWFRSDQEFLNSCGIRWPTWQRVLPDAIVSYKQNVLARRTYDGSPLDESKIRIVAYHGKPRPWEVETCERQDGEEIRLAAVSS